MGHSQRLRLRDLRDAYQLIGECQDVGADPVEWRKTMLTGVCRLVDAPLAMGGEGRWVGPERRFEFICGPMPVGPFNPKGLQFFAEHARTNLTNGDPVFGPLSRIRAALVMRAREQLLEDREWYRCPLCAIVREALSFDHAV